MLKRELGLTERDIVDIPQLFSLKDSYAEAFFPDMVRVQKKVISCRWGPAGSAGLPVGVPEERAAGHRDLGGACGPLQHVFAFWADIERLHQWFSARASLSPKGIFLLLRGLDQGSYRHLEGAVRAQPPSLHRAAPQRRAFFSPKWKKGSVFWFWCFGLPFLGLPRTLAPHWLLPSVAPEASRRAHSSCLSGCH